MVSPYKAMGVVVDDFVVFVAGGSRFAFFEPLDCAAATNVFLAAAGGGGS